VLQTSRSSPDVSLAERSRRGGLGAPRDAPGDGPAVGLGDAELWPSRPGRATSTPGDVLCVAARPEPAPGRSERDLGVAEAPRRRRRAPPRTSQGSNAISMGPPAMDWSRGADEPGELLSGVVGVDKEHRARLAGAAAGLGHAGDKLGALGAGANHLRPSMCQPPRTRSVVVANAELRGRSRRPGANSSWRSWIGSLRKPAAAPRGRRARRMSV
jgi:hypothetical protein